MNRTSLTDTLDSFLCVTVHKKECVWETNQKSATHDTTDEIQI